MDSQPVVVGILIVDEDPRHRSRIALVNAEAEMKLTAEASSGRVGIDLHRRLCPDVALMDLQMQGMDKGETVRAIQSEFPDTRVIVLMPHNGNAQISKAPKAGARASVPKEHLHRELLDTIRTVHVGQKRIASVMVAELPEYAANPLSSREIDVLRLVAAGSSNRRIAVQLSISVATVKSHVTNIFAKLGANDRAHAVAIGLTRGIFDL